MINSLVILFIAITFLQLSSSFTTTRSAKLATKILTLRMSNKIINSPESCVEDVVQGALLSDSRLSRVGNLNILVRADIDEVKKDRVTLISGGGSGHEPAHAGFIGEGLLSCAVLGNVFASPSVSSILAAIRVCAGPKGVLLIVKNYTGDRLNFGMAAELAKQEGIDVMMVIVADDCALPLGKGITGGRGIAGTVFIHKIAGATANTKASLSEVHKAATDATSLIGSMGVALSTCTVPGTTPSTRLSELGLMEIGMGIHGEPGREQMKVPEVGAAKTVANILVDGVLGIVAKKGVPVDSEGMEAPRLPYSDGQKVAVLLNNLGAVPVLEMAIIMKEVMLLLRGRDIVPIRAYSGPYMTSLEMTGVSLSLMLLENDSIGVTSLLDATTNAPAWVVSSILSETSSDLASRSIPYTAAESESKRSTPAIGKAIKSQACDGVAMLRVTKAICQKIIDLEPKLTEYDAICGDGDCGVVMKKGAQQVLADIVELEEKILASESHLIEVAPFFNMIGDSISASMGGTSGALLELCFRAMAASFTNTPTQASAGLLEMTKALDAGVEAIKYYGGANVGFRTMLDAFIPAVDQLKNGGTPLNAADAAMKGAEATKTMGSLAGRSNYVAEEKMKGIPDPGAAAIAAAFGTLAETL